MRNVTDAPPPLDPANDIPTEAKGICGIEQPPLRALQHVPLVDKVVQHRPALRDELVKARVRVLDERVLAQRVVLSRGAVHVQGRRPAEGRLGYFFGDWLWATRRVSPPCVSRGWGEGRC